MTDKKIPEEVDLTAEREKRCDDTVVAILKHILDRDLLFNDMPYVEQKTAEFMEGLIRTIVVENFNNIFEKLRETMVHHFNEATGKLWGKDRENISMQDIDRVLQEINKEK